MERLCVSLLSKISPAIQYELANLGARHVSVVCCSVWIAVSLEECYNWTTSKGPSRLEELTNEVRLTLSHRDYGLDQVEDVALANFQANIGTFHQVDNREN